MIALPSGARRLVTAAALSCAFAASAAGQTSHLLADTLHSRVLGANKYGDSPNRSLLVYLPPSYDSSPARRYPVIYLLHGFGSSERVWAGGYRGFHVQRSTDSLIAAGVIREMIIVMPNALTKFGGSFYTNSEATGDWDDLVSRELVSYVDGKYRTIARARSRGLAGHSMGGYGTFAVGMRHAGDVYTSLYAMSGCCTRFSSAVAPAAMAPWDEVSRAPDVDAASHLGFYAKVSLALAAAFAPDPANAPLFVDLPFRNENGQWRPVAAVQSKFREHAPQDKIPAYAERLKRLTGFAFDVGTSDQLVAPAGLAAMDSAFTRAGVPHTFETYEGDHTSGIGVRMITKVLPFFSRTLDFS